MEQQKVDFGVGEEVPSNDEAGLTGRDKQILQPVKKTPLRDLQSQNNIVAQKRAVDPLALKAAATTEVTKVSGVKRPSPEAPMNPLQQSPNGSVANGHLVYVRRKSEAEPAKSGSNEIIAEDAHSPQRSQLGHQEDRVQSKSLAKESRMHCQSANAPIPTPFMMCIPSEKAFIPPSLGSSDTKVPPEEHRAQAVPSPINVSAEGRVKRQNWEDRYIQLQMYLKKLDHSSLEDHLRALRSLSAGELSRHAVELEKRAIQLSLEQGKELQRVKALNVLGKSLRTSNDIPVQQKPQN